MLCQSAGYVKVKLIAGPLNVNHISIFRLSKISWLSDMSCKREANPLTTDIRKPTNHSDCRNVVGKSRNCRVGLMFVTLIVVAFNHFLESVTGDFYVNHL